MSDLDREEAILGIDAAWTEKQPTGVALIVGASGRWRACAVAPSYAAFIALSHGMAADWDARHVGSAPDAILLIKAVDRLLPGVRLSVVAVDMPIATVLISGRREADNVVSRAFWKQNCSVHSPNESRPGKISTSLVDGFTRQGFRLCGQGALYDGSGGHLIEVYPHPAWSR